MKWLYEHNVSANLGAFHLFGKGMPSEDYAREGRALVKRRRVDGEHTLVLRAESIRQERTGIHARVLVECNGAALAWSNFNVERDEDRVRLCNSAYSHLEHRNGNGRAEGPPGYPKTYLKNDLDQFCAGLWDAEIEQTMPIMMGGLSAPEPPCFVLRPYILEGGGTIVFAPPGRGKSYLMLLMAVSVDAGLSTLWQVQQRRAMFINLERSQRLVEGRLGNVNDALGLPRDRPLLTLNARGKSLRDVLAGAERAVREQDVGCIFLDSISRAGQGDLNDNQSVNAIVDALNSLCETWVGLGHTPRADESHVYGGIHFDAGADVCVQLLSQQETNGPLGLGLQITKQNDVGTTPLWMVALDFSETGLVGVREARPGEFPEIEQKRKLSMREQIREHLLDMGAQSASDLADELNLNRSNVAALLRTDPVFVQAGRLGKKVLYGVRDANVGNTSGNTSGRRYARVVGGVATGQATHEPEELPF